MAERLSTMADVLDLAAGAVSLIGDAAAPYVLITQAGRSIGNIVPNVTIQEVVSDENVITQHPVATGAPISDHVFAAPVTVEMFVGWSDSTGGYAGYSEEIYQLFLTLRDTRVPFDVYTGKRMFSNMLFRSILQETNETNENALFLRVRMEKVIISDSSTSSGGVTAANQQFPQQTAPPTDRGTVNPEVVPGAPIFVQYMSLFGG